MFEDRNMMRFVYALLGFASIIVPGPIVPLVSLIIVIAMLVHRIKRVKESEYRAEIIMLDIIIIGIVLVIDIGILAMRISVEKEYNKYDYSSSSSEEISTSDMAEAAIMAYRLGNLSQFSDKGNHQSTIKSGFTTYLKEELELTDVTVKGNEIVCNVGSDTIIFTVTKNDIKYSIR